MNHLTNDRGVRVIAVGAPGSEARLKCEYPAQGKSALSARQMIKKEGLRTTLEIESMLCLLGYDAEEAAKLARG